MSKGTRIVITLEGGMIQAITADGQAADDIEVYTIDYDARDGDAEEGDGFTYRIPGDDDDKLMLAWVCSWSNDSVFHKPDQKLLDWLTAHEDELP